MAALARGFSDRHFERGEGPGDEVGHRFLGNQIALRIAQQIISQVLAHSGKGIKLSLRNKKIVVVSQLTGFPDAASKIFLNKIWTLRFAPSIHIEVG